jgi:hypothetical protein
MLALLKNLFSKKSAEVAVESRPTPEFHEEIKQQVEAENSFPVTEDKPAVKTKAKKPIAKKAPAKIKATAKPAPKKSK